MDDPVVALNAALDGRQAKIWTALPAIVESFDSEKMTCSLQVAVQARVLDKEGNWSNVTLPLLQDCPVQFPSGDKFILTMPIKKGDEGIVIFASRCIDAWWQSGDVQPQAEYRMHDLSDGMFIPGVFSQPRKISNFNADAPELRNGDGSIKFTMTAIGFKVTGTLEVTGDVIWPKGQITGAGISIDGVLNATQDVTAGQGTLAQVSLQHHTHGGVQPGAGHTTPPDV